MAKIHRCKNCERILCEGDLVQAKIICPKSSCKILNEISYIAQEAALKVKLIDIKAT